MFKYFYFVALWVLFGGTLRAEPEAVTVEFSVLAIGSPPREQLGILDAEGHFLPILVQTRSRSKVYRYHGPSPLRFYSRGEAENGDPPLEVGAVPIPSGVERILVLAFSSPGELDFRVIDDSVDNFNFGSYRYINMTGRNLGVQHDLKRFLLDASKSRTITPDTEAGGRYSLKIAAEGDDGAILAFSNSNRHYTRARYLCLITEYSPPRRAVRVETVTELPGEVVVLEPIGEKDPEN